MSTTYQLKRECLDNVEDDAIRWQISGGQVFENKEHVGNYSCTKRISCGTKEQNTAQVWLTLFFLGEAPPQNMTLLGSHDFNSGGQIGSVSAASSAFAANIGKQFKRSGDTLKIA